MISVRRNHANTCEINNLVILKKKKELYVMIYCLLYIQVLKKLWLIAPVEKKMNK